jgi:hypothetical protein
MNSYTVSVSNMRAMGGFIRKYCSNIEFNSKQLQQINSSVCGKYAAVFLIYCFNGIPYNFLKYFSKNTFINDMQIEKLFMNLKK